MNKPQKAYLLLCLVALIILGVFAVPWQDEYRFTGGRRLAFFIGYQPIWQALRLDVATEARQQSRYHQDPENQDMLVMEFAEGGFIRFRQVDIAVKPHIRLLFWEAFCLIWFFAAGMIALGELDELKHRLARIAARFHRR